jgi:prevent-host-death family protein
MKKRERIGKTSARLGFAALVRDVDEGRRHVITVTDNGRPAAVIAPATPFGSPRGLIDLSRLSKEALVRLNLWAGTDGDLEREARLLIGNQIGWEAERRGWPEEWWEDPSVLEEAS